MPPATTPTGTYDEIRRFEVPGTMARCGNQRRSSGLLPLCSQVNDRPRPFAHGRARAGWLGQEQRTMASGAHQGPYELLSRALADSASDVLCWGVLRRDIMSGNRFALGFPVLHILLGCVSGRDPIHDRWRLGRGRTKLPRHSEG
jgi:hypothetical protein